MEGALKAKSSDAGSAALGKGYTIDEALIMAEFEGNQDATEELESVIADEPDQLLHVAQLLRDRRASAAALAALTEELEGQGATIVEDAGHYASLPSVGLQRIDRARRGKPIGARSTRR